MFALLSFVDSWSHPTYMYKVKGEEILVATFTHYSWSYNVDLPIAKSAPSIPLREQPAPGVKW